MVMLDYWKIQTNLKLKRKCRGCRKKYDTGHVTLCSFAGKPNMIFCEQCQPIPAEALERAKQKRRDGHKNTAVTY